MLVKRKKEKKLILKNNMELNTNEIRFRGRFEIPESIDPEKDYIFIIKGQRIEVTHHDNNDGTYDARHVVGITEIKLVKNKENI